LQRDLSVIVTPMLRPNAKHTPAEFAKADADLNAFNTRVDETILADGSKSFKDIATAKLDALSAKIRAANLDRTDAAPLETGIAAARKDIDTVIANVQKKQAGLTFDQFEERLARLAMEVDSTIALAANRGKAKTLMEAFTNKANALNSKITQARLNNFFTNDFVFTLTEITVRLPENCRTSHNSKQTMPCDIATLLEGDKRLDALSSTVDTVITTYGTKSVEIIYGTALREAATKLNQSKVGAADKMRLSRNMMPIQDMIKQADISPRVSPNAAQADRRTKFSPEQLHNDVQAAINEIEAAIRLAGPR
jgi:hypothetical protein